MISSTQQRRGGAQSSRRGLCSADRRAGALAITVPPTGEKKHTDFCRALWRASRGSDTAELTWHTRTMWAIHERQRNDGRCGAYTNDTPDAKLLQRLQSIVGGLLYCSTSTRPDIAFAVGMLCRAMSRPTPELLEAALRVLGYPYRTRDLLGLNNVAEMKPIAGMSDSDWAVNQTLNFWMGLPVLSSCRVLGLREAEIRGAVLLRS